MCVCGRRYPVHLQLASSFPRRFGEAVSRCRKIGEAGSQQLLLDTHAVRSLLLGFPASGEMRFPAFLLLEFPCLRWKSLQLLLETQHRALPAVWVPRHSC